jgi:PTH1 family peptidyl-tRNA hydrolase
MNVSGPSVLAAWKAFQRDNGHNPADMNTKEAGLALVVVHDELESALGKVAVKPGSGSARGHNGLKSIKGSFPGQLEYKRIGVGIGRPESREPNDVANYVLRSMTGTEKSKLEAAAGSVLAELERMTG